MHLHSLGALENLCVCTGLKGKVHCYYYNLTMILRSCNVFHFVQIYTVVVVRSGLLPSKRKVQMGVNYWDLTLYSELCLFIFT